MKKFTKPLLVCLVVVMVASCFAGCGATTTTTDDTSATSTTTDGGTFVIGATGPLTGDASSYGISVQQGAQLAVDEINANGGINGCQIEFVMKDDQADPELASTAYDQLMDAGMIASIGSTTSGACEAFASKSESDNLFFVTPSASAATVIADRDNGFRICFGDPDQGELAADYLVNTKGFTKIGAIYDTSDAYSSGIYEAFENKMVELGVEFTTQTFDAENNKDFSSQVKAMADCEVIFTPFYYTEAGLVAKACVANGVNALIFGADGLDGVAGQVDSSVTNEITYITPFDVNSEDEGVVAFVSAYEDKYGVTPDQFAADAYDAVYALSQAMEEAEVTPDMDCSDVTDLLVDVFTSMEFTGVTGNITWDETGAPQKSLNIVTVEK